MSIQIQEGRSVTVTPVRGGFIIEWDDVKLVQKSTIIDVDKYADKPSPVNELKKTTSASEYLLMTAGHQVAVRESVDGAIKLLAEVLKMKLEVIQSIDASNGKITVPGPSCEAVPSPAEKKW